MHEDEAAPNDALVKSENLRKTTRYIRAYAFGAIVFAFFAGMKVQAAIQRFRAGNYDWISDTLLILVWLAISIAWTSRALSMNRDTASSASNTGAIK